MFTKSKKGVELGMNVIVIAVIVLAVLVVTIIVFSGRFNIFSKEVSDCQNYGGLCLKKEACTDGRSIDGLCKGEGEVCCYNACTIAGGTANDGKCVLPAEPAK